MIHLRELTQADAVKAIGRHCKGRRIDAAVCMSEKPSPTTIFELVLGSISQDMSLDVSIQK